MPKTRKTTAKTGARVRKRVAKSPHAAPSQVEESLLIAVERLLERGQSFASLTVAQMTQEAGIGRATFYLHFKDKGELVQRLMQRLTQEVVVNAGVWFQGGQVDPRSMQLALRGIVTTFKKHAAILSAISDTAPQDRAVAQAHQKMMQALCALSRKAIASARRQGTATPQANAELADLLTLSIEAYCAKHIQHIDGKQLDSLIDKVSHICGRAIFRDYPDSPQ